MCCQEQRTLAGTRKHNGNYLLAWLFSQQQKEGTLNQCVAVMCFTVNKKIQRSINMFACYLSQYRRFGTIIPDHFLLLEKYVEFRVTRRLDPFGALYGML